MHDCSDGVTEAQARQRLVPSKTTLLGLIKHLTYVEGLQVLRELAQHAGHADILREHLHVETGR